MSARVDTLPGWESLAPAVRQRFLAADLPARFLTVNQETATFTLGPELAEADVPTLGPVLRFGRGGGAYDGDFCIALRTGAVHLVQPDNPPAFVNSNLDLFARTLRLVLRYERKITTGDADDCASAADRIRDGIERMDEPATDTDTYWDAVCYDFAAGSYSDNPEF